MKEYHKFLDGAMEASNLKKDPDIVYVTFGEITEDYSGIVTIGPKPVLFTPVGLFKDSFGGYPFKY